MHIPVCLREFNFGCLEIHVFFADHNSSTVILVAVDSETLQSSVGIFQRLVEETLGQASHNRFQALVNALMHSAVRKNTIAASPISL